MLWIEFELVCLWLQEQRLSSGLLGSAEARTHLKSECNELKTVMAGLGLAKR